MACGETDASWKITLVPLAIRVLIYCFGMINFRNVWEELISLVQGCF